MSIEEKAKAYDEAFSKAKRLYEGKDKTPKEPILEYLFPQLRESEDEIHRKWILEYLYDGLRKTDEQFKDHFKSAIDWLEKQKEQKPAWSEEDEKIIDTIISVLGQYINYKTVSGSSSGYTTPMYIKEIDWLNSLRPSWKPSNKQMEVFQNTMQRLLRAGETGKWYATLKSLYEQLKKLGVKEEPEYYQHFDPDC